MIQEKIYVLFYEKMKEKAIDNVVSYAEVHRILGQLFHVPKGYRRNIIKVMKEKKLVVQINKTHIILA